MVQKVARRIKQPRQTRCLLEEGDVIVLYNDKNIPLTRTVVVKTSNHYAHTACGLRFDSYAKDNVVSLYVKDPAYFVKDSGKASTLYKVWRQCKENGYQWRVASEEDVKRFEAWQDTFSTYNEETQRLLIEAANKKSVRRSAIEAALKAIITPSTKREEALRLLEDIKSEVQKIGVPQ